MWHGLPGLFTLIDDQPITAVQAKLLRHPFCNEDQTLVVTFLSNFCHTGDFGFGHDEHVDRRNRGNVSEGNAMLIFVHDVSRDLSLNDLGE